MTVLLSTEMKSWQFAGLQLIKKLLIDTKEYDILVGQNDKVRPIFSVALFEVVALHSQNRGVCSIVFPLFSFRSDLFHFIVISFPTFSS